MRPEADVIRQRCRQAVSILRQLGWSFRKIARHPYWREGHGESVMRRYFNAIHQAPPPECSRLYSCRERAILRRHDLTELTRLP